MGFAFPSRVTPHSVGRCHVVTEGTAAVSGGGGESRRMRWKAVINCLYFTVYVCLHLISHSVTGAVKKTKQLQRRIN